MTVDELLVHLEGLRAAGHGSLDVFCLVEHNGETIQGGRVDRADANASSSTRTSWQPGLTRRWLMPSRKGDL